ncbi:polysaccharide deacetylase family protein [Aquimarina sp. U1-2]|uniref:polysaccharide deacetylase family protein n=1 Tax=Aquimarina sp. U1-2 TaxID=2823141 RepID=UPI001AEC7F51|nr:polysaccharide deacetylase family protein [Aquimarina sp. U1-2]MBP2831008.1 polysaccharide deacetylase family protein [Aquimarina sp. U1-2]
MGFVKNLLYKISTENLLFIFRKQPLFPYYHIVSDKAVHHIDNLYDFKNKKQFEEDLDFLLHTYKPLDPEALWNNGCTENSFLLTFDDGLSEIYTNIYPILKSKGIKAIFFINPDFVDNKEILYKHEISIVINHLKKSNVTNEQKEKLGRMLFNTTENYNTTSAIKAVKNITYQEREMVRKVSKILKINIEEYLAKNKPYVSSENIKEMLNDGFFFGSHTMSHPPLQQLTIEEQKKQIIDAIEWMKNQFHIKQPSFAFPFTDRGISKSVIQHILDYDQNLLIFGNSGMKKDVNNRIIQRFSLEKPSKKIGKVICTEHLYKYYNKIIGSYTIKRKYEHP